MSTPRVNADSIAAKQTKTQSLQAPKLMPDFRHRLPPGGDNATPWDLSDGVSTQANQAISILTMLNAHFIEDTSCRPSDDSIYWAIDSAIKLIMDMDSLVDAYRKAVSPEQ
ncbi:hypothetical protein [Methylobacter sp. BBA5.1]|uniref:hypothetical protein n=1 Tax=Methylobacter sp. BBA5.1 TaxID=1495064 RepID=UPI00056C2629|nr:hypothetical protein [Methylobacter sp. BBA5.1]